MQEVLEKEEHDTITKVLLKLGLQPKLLGFEYIREAIKLYRKKKTPRIVEVYEEISRSMGKKTATIERNIRTAVDDAFNKGGLLGINECFGAIVYTNDYKLTSFELIALASELLAFMPVQKSENQSDF